MESGVPTLSNRVISLLLAEKGREASHFVQKAMRKAARLALLWPGEAADLWRAGKPLTELKGIGPHLAGLITDWLAAPPPVPVPAPESEDFLTLAEARRILGARPKWKNLIRGDIPGNWSSSTSDSPRRCSRAFPRNAF